MNKIFTFFFFAIIFSSFSLFLAGQNLVQNGDLESWTNTTTPEGWDKIENIEQESNTVYGGAYAAKHISQDGTTDFMQEVEGISAGANYTISYYYLDNDPMARARIWSYWTSGGTTLDDHADILRPGTYSEDNPDWIEWQAELTAPAGADGFRFEVRVYRQDGNFGGSVFYDDFSVIGAGVSPEPTNYPGDFTAVASGLNIDLTWSDATGAQLPNAYLILASDEDNIQPPVDGNFVNDDTDLSDGSGALNAAYGDEMAEFKNLMGATPYYFAIFPYTNGGPAVDYKTDGSYPTATATTGNLSVIEFIDFNDGWQQWTLENVTGQQIWENDNNFGLEGTPCAQMSGYSGGAVVNEDWLISPAMNFNNYDGEILHFWSARNYDGPDIEVLISVDYAGSGDPNDANWDALSAVLSEDDWEWTASGDVDVSAAEGETVYIAFKYTSTSSDAASWEIEDVLVTGIEKVGVPDIIESYDISVYPNPMRDFLVVEGPENLYNVELLTMTGRKINSVTVNPGQSIKINELPTGIYFVRVKPADEIHWDIRKLIVN
jgi:hypothetical protein